MLLRVSDTIYESCKHLRSRVVCIVSSVPVKKLNSIAFVFDSRERKKVHSTVRYLIGIESTDVLVAI